LVKIQPKLGLKRYYFLQDWKKVKWPNHFISRNCFKKGHMATVMSTITKKKNKTKQKKISNIWYVPPSSLSHSRIIICTSILPIDSMFRILHHKRSLWQLHLLIKLWLPPTIFHYVNKRVANIWHLLVTLALTIFSYFSAY